MPFYTMPDGEALFVREYGQGQPVLVLSGLGMLSWQWSAFLYSHRQNFRFIIPDWRGFGPSKHCKIPAHLDAISSHWRDIACLIQQLNLDRLIVIAYSMGATTTMHGLKYGNFQQSIGAYLHIDQTPQIKVDQHWPYGLFANKQAEFLNILKNLSQLLTAQQHLNFVHELDVQAQQQLTQLWLAFISLQNTNQVSLKAMKWILNQKKLQGLLLPSNRLDYLAWYINNYLYHDENYHSAIQSLSCPVTFFSGVQSKLYPVMGQNIVAKSIPQAKQIQFQHSGHTPLLSEPLKFARELKSFLYASNDHIQQHGL